MLQEEEEKNATYGHRLCGRASKRRGTWQRWRRAIVQLRRPWWLPYNVQRQRHLYCDFPPVHYLNATMLWWKRRHRNGDRNNYIQNGDRL